MNIALTQASGSLSLTTPLGENKLILEEIVGEERLCGLFEFDLVARLADPSLDPSSIVGKAIGVTLIGGDGTRREINGVCARLTRAFDVCRLQMRPWLWLLSLSFGSRIFQRQSTPDILKAVFADANQTDFKDQLTASYPPREYCVQYQETALAFVSRLMEEAGISWRFDHANGKHMLTLIDDDSGYDALPGDPLIYLPLGADNAWAEERRVESFSLAAEVTSDAYATTDFNFETPTNDLMSKAGKSGSPREVYEFPGFFEKKDAGEALARRRNDALLSDAKSAEGASPFRGLAPGYTFEIKGHPQTSANGKYRLHAVRHEAALGRYANSFEARPAAQPFRPPRATPRPLISGSQTAIVTGQSGEEIWTDKDGRIKVHFPWDRLGKPDETSSCWMRVALGLAGNGFGFFTLPRVGQEVVVTFLDGDPDRPLVTGAVYNGTHTPPYPLPANATRSTWKTNSSKGGGGFNELRFEDLKDSEEIYLHAQKDMLAEIGNNLVTNIAKDETLAVKGARKLTVTGDENHKNDGAIVFQIGKDLTIKADGDITIQAGGKITIKSGAEFAIEAGAAMSMKAGADLTAQASAAMTLKAGADLTAQASAGVTLKAGANLTAQAGANAQLKGGAQASVEGGAMASVKGAMVQLN